MMQPSEFFHSGKFQRAVLRAEDEYSILRNTAKNKPDDPFIACAFITELRARGMYHEALIVAEKLLRHMDDPFVELQKLALLQALSLTNQALLLAKKVVNRESQNPLALSVLGWGTYCLENKQLGRDILKNAVLQHPTDPDVLFAVATIMLDSGEVEGALGLLEAAVKKEPRDPQLRLYLGRAYKQSGHLDKAAVQVQEAMMHGGEVLHTWYLYGRISGAYGDYDKTVDIAKELVKYYPSSYLSHKLMAEGLIGANEFHRALPFLRRSLDREAKNPELYTMFRATLDHIPRGIALKYALLILVDRICRRLTFRH